MRLFKIEDGRTAFYQWDSEQRLIVSDPSITEVHFCNRTDDCSLVCEVYEENGKRLTNVPNILLQEDWRINVYAYCSCATKTSAIFNVISRSKPEDYVYTETEIKRWEQLEQRVEDIEANVGTIVEEYIKENPIPAPEVDLTGYATEKYVDDAISAIDIPTPEASVEEIHIGTSAPTDENIKVWINPNETTEFATVGYVDNKVDGIVIPEPDLSGYALKSDIPDVTGFTTMSAVEAKGYQTEAQVTTAINTALGVIENGTY